MGMSIAELAYRNALNTTAPGVNPAEAGDPWASYLTANGWLNPATDDAFSSSTANRIFNQYLLPNMSWQDLLKNSFQEMGGSMGTPDLPVYDNLVKRLNATGWSDEQKKQAVLNAANQHYARFGSSYTGWSTEEGIAGLLGLPDYSTAAHQAAQQQYSDAHTAYSEQANADSLANALKLGSVVAAPFVVGGLTSAGVIPAGTVEGFGTGAAGGLAEEMAALGGFAGSTPIAPAATAGAAAGTGAGMELTTPDWLTELLQQTGEAGIPAAQLEGGFNAALSNAPWWSGLPTQLQSLVQSAGNAASQLNTATNAINAAQNGPLGRILGGNASAADWASVLGNIGSTALGVYGSNQQAQALTDIANQARADRQPFLNKSLEWLNDPAAYAAGPGKASLDAVLRGLSVQGNPFGSPTSMALAGDIANRNWQNAVTGFGNLGLSGSDSRNSLLASAADADRGVTASLASGLGTLTQPDNSLESLLRRLSGTGINLTGIT